MATKILTAHFTSAGVPQFGLTPTIDIFELHPTNPTTNSHVVVSQPVVEVGMGWYRYNFSTYDPTRSYVFTFDGGPTLPDCDRYKYGGNESYVDDIAPAVWDQASMNHVSAGTTGEVLAQIKADTATISVNEVQLLTLLSTLLKYERNRTRIDVTNAQMIIYDDDCTTPLTVFNLRDFNGMPSVEEVCERIPTTC